MKKQRPQIRHNLKNAEEAKKRLMKEAEIQVCFRPLAM